ncbi:hypothetical protein EVAR_60045_1 [Eumeta japonica]|uniref:Uncharacterized protein n=1 Tax=Eumeta variegata TaxID=151549 RepID=A0A4C1YUB8_EUMVA|nr:hypothetical protein EVAR_60045_1 [Eumeta japonica]
MGRNKTSQIPVNFQMLVFDPAKRISVVDALAHPYLEEGRLRYHSCMCKCCYSSPPAARHYSPDLEPTAPHAFHDSWERKLATVHQVKGIKWKRSDYVLLYFEIGK